MKRLDWSLFDSLLVQRCGGGSTRRPGDSFCDVDHRQLLTGVSLPEGDDTAIGGGLAGAAAFVTAGSGSAVGAFVTTSGAGVAASGGSTIPMTEGTAGSGGGDTIVPLVSTGAGGSVACVFRDHDLRGASGLAAFGAGACCAGSSFVAFDVRVGVAAGIGGSTTG